MIPTNGLFLSVRKVFFQTDDFIDFVHFNRPPHPAVSTVHWPDILCVKLSVKLS